MQTLPLAETSQDKSEAAELLQAAKALDADPNAAGSPISKAGLSDWIPLNDPTVPPGLSPIPRRFLIAEGGDMKRAVMRWKATVDWRLEWGAETVLTTPHPNFDIIKKYYKHMFHLPDRHGHLVYYEMPGQINLPAVSRHGICREELLQHYRFNMEFLWRELQPRETDKLTIVLDCEGVGMRDLRGESAQFLKSTVSMMSTHYPQRSFKILILNAPGVVNLGFAAVKSLLSESTKAKIAIVPASQTAFEMLQVVAPENLPVAYGGTCSTPLGQSPSEQQLREYVLQHLAQASTPMQPVPLAAEH